MQIYLMPSALTRLSASMLPKFVKSSFPLLIRHLTRLHVSDSTDSLLLLQCYIEFIHVTCNLMDSHHQKELTSDTLIQKTYHALLFFTFIEQALKCKEYPDNFRCIYRDMYKLDKEHGFSGMDLNWLATELGCGSPHLSTRLLSLMKLESRMELDEQLDVYIGDISLLMSR